MPTKSSRTAFTLAVVWWAWCGLWVLFWLICGFLTFGVGWIFAILSFALAMLAFLWWRP
ncbi:MAG: hypothetical protein J2P28_25865 [Actinobacteria bacterium]|nr:hypothetical protein [Actinomycetota bacterium]